MPLTNPNDEEARLKVEQLHLQNEKLRFEIKAASQSFLANPTTWFSGLLALVAAGGLFIQYSLLNYDLKQAKIDRDLAAIEKGKAEAEKREAVAEKVRAVEVAEQAKTRLGEDQLKLAETKESLAISQRELKTARDALGTIVVTGAEVPIGMSISVRGHVVDMTGTPLREVILRVIRNGAAVATSQTTPDGRFDIHIPSGERFDLVYESQGREIGIQRGLAGNASHTLRLVVLPQAPPI